MNPLTNLERYNIRLCSGSPRRRELLAMTGIPFSIDTSREVDETPSPGLAAQDVPLDLARRKASAYMPDAAPGDLVIAADTVVILDGCILGKPGSAAEAVDMLWRLQGRTHEVVTGVAVMTPDRQESFGVSTLVEFAPLSRNDIETYVREYSPLDKAGAYGIQEWIGAVGVKSINGSFYNVMGLPVQRLYDLLRTF